MRTFLVWLLLGLTPFTGVRLVCIERAPAMPAVTEVNNAPHCDRFCPRPSADTVTMNTSEMECLFVADGTVLMVVTAVAVLPTSAAVPFGAVSVAVGDEPHDRYLAPFLAHRSPPPRG